MDFNPAQHTGLFAALLLLPGMLFMFVLVIYITFIGRASTENAGAARTCLKCGRTLLPEQLECPDCVPQMNPPVTPTEAERAPAGMAQPESVPRDGAAESSQVAEGPGEPAAAATIPADSSAAYEGEIVEEADDRLWSEHD